MVRGRPRRRGRDTLDGMSTYDAPGVARQIRFDAKGDLAPGRLDVWTFALEGDSVYADQIIAG